MTVAEPGDPRPARGRRRVWKPRRGQRLWTFGSRVKLFPPGEWRRAKRKRSEEGESQ